MDLDSLSSLSSDSSDDDDSSGRAADGSKRIPKPPGEAGRPNCGGYNLEEQLGWPEIKYNVVNVSQDQIIVQQSAYRDAEIR